MFRPPATRSILLFAAFFALAVMVVLLGAAAKHSQFESSSHHSHYLAKAVKMVYAGTDDGASPAFPPASETPVAATFSRLRVHPSAVLRTHAGAPLTTPLLL